MFWKKTIYIILFIVLIVTMIAIGLASGFTIIQDKTIQDTWFHLLFIELPHNLLLHTLENQNIDTSMILIIMPLILLSITLSFLSILTLAIFVIAFRTFSLSRDLVHEKLRLQYQGLIIDYLVNDSQAALDELMKAQSDTSKTIIIRQLLNLQKNIIGNTSDKLRRLFLQLNFTNHALNQLNSEFWHVKIENIRILSAMGIAEAKPHISKYLYASNQTLRMEAQQALINLERDNPFDFLNKIRHPLSEWQQLNIYDIMTRNSIKAPDFAIYLHSKNESVVLFCLKMIRAFNQTGAYERIAALLKDQNEAIRNQSIRTLAEFGNKDAILIFKEIYPGETPDNRIAIIRSMAKLRGDKAITFTEAKLHDPDISIQGEARKALYSLYH